MAQDIRFPRLNTVILSGHLTREVELRYTPNGKSIARMGLAFNRVYKNAEGNWIEEANFIDVKAFGKSAEDCAERLHKGSPIIVEGYINTFTYTTKENQQRKITEISANKIHYLERQTATESVPKEPSQGNDDFESGEKHITDNDVPF